MKIVLGILNWVNIEYDYFVEYLLYVILQMILLLLTQEIRKMKAYLFIIALKVMLIVLMSYLGIDSKIIFFSIIYDYNSIKNS